MTTHNHHDDDDALPGEDELRALYGSLPRKEPSPALDQAVRHAARQAVHVPARRRMPHWPITAASAAVLVLVAGVSWRLMQIPGGAAPAPTAAMQSPSAPPAAPAVNTNAATPTPAPPMAAKTAAPSRETVVNSPHAQVPMHAMAKARAASPAPVEHAAAQLAAPSVQSEAPADDRAAYAPPAAPALATPIIAPPAAKPEAATNLQGRMAMKVMPAPAPMPAPVQMATTPDPTALNPSDTPAQELDKIRQLFTLQRRDEALHRLDAFRQSHPDVALPDDLRAQLPDHE